MEEFSWVRFILWSLVGSGAATGLLGILAYVILDRIGQLDD